MRIFSINSVPYGSTAKIMFGIADVCNNANINHITSTGFSTHPIEEVPKYNIPIGNIFDKTIHMVLSELSGYNGIFSKNSTKKLIKEIDKWNPDIIHLHNLHGWYLNLPLLFDYIKSKGINVVWTLHDCWSFTGRCPHFTMANCQKWGTGCSNCQYSKKEYPQAAIDRSERMWELKRKWFTGVDNLTVVTPSQWLADLVAKSYLKNYSIKVINNGINLNIYTPTKSDFRDRYHITKDKFIILGVAFGWGKRKGLDVFIELSKRLNNKFQIVLVGTDNNTDKVLPENIISINRTQNQKELASIYTAADLFVNPTREENYPTVNMEAIACGTPVVTFQTGGSAEMLDDTCGSVVECDNIDALINEIVRISEDRPFTEISCLNKAKQFNMDDRFKEYVQLYENILQ